MKIRIRFRKFGVMKFVGHLDMMRYFQKVMRRAEIDIAYSEGFSPHQIMSFAAPLGVGLTSDGEYLDIEVHSTPSSRQALQQMNDAMVEGVEVMSYRRLPDNAKTAMSIVAAADYRVSYQEACDCPFSFSELKEKLHVFYDEAEQIPVTKKTKKGEKTMDLKQLIYDLKAVEDEGRISYKMKVSTGSVDNVKPELVLEAFYAFLGLDLPDQRLQIHRMDVYGTALDGSVISLEEMGEDIE
ncbi:MAG: TIGR03936 family radical SAM-associated protein [Lachnospiraceae bacterium]|nr:TIGR03936 family radical SAM-associated protein [Lachnospiraceae bacterium]